MSKSLGNQIGITEPPGGDVRQDAVIPDALLAEWYGLLLGTTPPEGMSAARRQARAGAGARGALPRRGGRRGGRGAFQRVFVEHALPDDIEESVVHRRTAPCTSRS